MGFKIQGEFNLKGNASSALKSVGSALRGVKNDGSQVGSVLGRTSTAMRNAGSSASQAGRDANAGARGFTNFAQAARHAGDIAQKAAKRASDAWRTSANTIKGITGAFSSMALPTALVAGGVGLAGKSIIDAVGYKEQQLIGFNTMLKSTTLGLSTYKYALKFAAETPFETPGVIAATKKLVSFGFSLKQIPGLLKSTGNAASGLSLGQEGFERLGTIFGQVKSKGKLQGDELLQLDEMGLGVRDALKKAYAGLDFNKILEKGQIRADDALAIIQKDLDKRFGGLMKKQATSIFGLVSTLKSRPFELFQSLDADKELKPVKNVLENLSALTDFENNPMAKKIKSRFVNGANSIFKAAFGPLADSTDPDKIGAYMDKVFNKLDQAGAWLETNGPGIVTGFKGFFTGIGDTINTVRGAIDWASGAFGKLSPVLDALGIGGGKKDDPSGSSFARAAGGLGSAVVGGLGLNGILGGIPGDLLKSAGEKAFGALQEKVAEKFGFGGDVQKVFVTNIGGGLGGSGLPDPTGGLGGSGGGPGGARGGFVTRMLTAARTRFGSLFSGAQGLAGRVLSRLPGMQSALLNMTTRIGLNASLLGSVIGRNMMGFAGRFAGSLSSLGGTVIGKLGLAGAAFGGGWMVGSALNGVNTGGVNNDTGGSRTFGYDVQEGLRYLLFDGAKADEIKNNQDNADFEKSMRTKQQLRRGKQFGLDLGGDKTIASAAIEGLSATWTEQTAGFCSRFVRQVFEKGLGKSTGKLFGANAFESEQRFQKAGLTRSLGDINKSGGLRPGDVLFNKDGGDVFKTVNGKRKLVRKDGHTGIVVQDPKSGKLMVAENSNRHGTNVRDGRYLTPLERFGQITNVGRYGAGGGAPSTGQVGAGQAGAGAGAGAGMNLSVGAGPSGTGGVHISLKFGDIIVGNAKDAQGIGQAVVSSLAAKEQEILEVFERLAAQMGGRTVKA